MNQRYILTYLFFFFAVLSYDISFQVPASGICENRYCKDGEKGVWAACWRGFAKVRVVYFCVWGGALKLVQGRVYIRIRRGCRFESFVYQADAGVC